MGETQHEINVGRKMEEPNLKYWLSCWVWWIKRYCRT